jgi:hypothetical protein
LKEACTSFHFFVTSRFGGKKALDWTQKYAKLSRGARTIDENLPQRHGYDSAKRKEEYGIENHRHFRYIQSVVLFPPY